MVDPITPTDPSQDPNAEPKSLKTPEAMVERVQKRTADLDAEQAQTDAESPTEQIAKGPHSESRGYIRGLIKSAKL
jgi:hypothetical protein